MEVVNNYKFILDGRNLNKDKQIPIRFFQHSEMSGRDDLINQRAEQKVEEIFKEDYPTIDFEKYCFKPESSLSELNMYFYNQLISTGQPISYNDNLPPEWVIDSTTQQLNNKFVTKPIISSIPWSSSYFKFDFYQSIIGEQKILFSIALPVNGTMLIAGDTPKPRIIFNQTPKTEINDIFWLRKPDQLPGAIFTGNTYTLYCTVNFSNSLTGKIQRFKAIPNGENSSDYLPTSDLLRTTFTERYYFLKYVLDYSTLTYKITRYDNTEFTNGIINLYSN